jgi:hypothetical protein
MVSSNSSLLRALVIYAVVVPVALLLGFMLATPMNYQSLGTVLLVLTVLASPLIFTWHRPLLYLAWNMNAVLLFLPGGLPLWMAAAGLSLTICLVQRALVSDVPFISAPLVVAPMIFLLAVVFMTQELTGGFGLRIFGSASVGGKNYLMIYGAAAGFFAMLAYRIPRHKAMFYTGLFLLGSLTNVISSTADLLPSKLFAKFYYIYYLFPLESLPTDMTIQDLTAPESITRKSGLGFAAAAFFSFLLARYGVKEMLSGTKFWRFLLLSAAFVVTMYGGYRNAIAYLALVFLLVFYMEGLLRSRYTVILSVLALVGSLIAIPMATKMPMAFQRAISFLPVEVDPEARIQAEASTDWRWRMWHTLVPEVPRYLLLGKGVSISAADNELAEQLARTHRFEVDDPSAMVGNFHNGPLSALIFFGIWGMIAWIWFSVAGLRALYLNFRYGDETLKKINTFLLAVGITKFLMFFVIFGDIRSDFLYWAGLLGLSLSLNHGICKRIVESRVQAKPIPIKRTGPMRFSPGLSR